MFISDIILLNYIIKLIYKNKIFSLLRPLNICSKIILKYSYNILNYFSIS